MTAGVDLFVNKMTQKLPKLADFGSVLFSISFFIGPGRAFSLTEALWHKKYILTVT